MNDEQKRILEDIHKKTENLMVEKANLTLQARKSILEENYPDNIILEQIRKIDEAIAGVYRKQINHIKQESLKMKTLAKSEYGNPIIESDKKTEYYTTGPNKMVFKSSDLTTAKIRVDSAQFELYEQLFREISNIEEEQRNLWKYLHNEKVTMVDLEKIFRANLNDMKPTMSTIKEKIEKEKAILTIRFNALNQEVLDLQKYVNKRHNKYGQPNKSKSLQNKLSELNKKIIERDKLIKQINEVNSKLNDVSKNQYERDMEASNFKKETAQKNQEKKDIIKQQRREENERRRQENIRKQQEREAKIAEQKRLEEQKKLEEQQKLEEQKKQEQKVQEVKSIARPKNKMSLKEKLKRVAVAAVAAVTAFTAGIGLFNGRKAEKSNDIPTVTPNTQTEEYNNTNPMQKNVTPEKKDNKVTINYETQTPTSTQENKQTVSQDIHISETEDIEYTETAGLWSTVKIGDKIYDNMNSALNHQNELNPYFDSNKEYTVIGVIYSNGVQTTSVDTTMQNCNELEETLKSQGFKPQGYKITTKRADEIDLTNANNLDGKITGYVPADEIIQEMQMEQGRAR